MESLGGKRDRGDRPQVPHKEDKGPDLAAPLVAVSKEFHHTVGRVEGGGGGGGGTEKERFVFVIKPRGSRACMRASYPCASSMEYFHWFHGQQTRLHDANNTAQPLVPVYYARFSSRVSRSCSR